LQARDSCSGGLEDFIDAQEGVSDRRVGCFAVDVDLDASVKISIHAIAGSPLPNGPAVPGFELLLLSEPAPSMRPTI
jgi:hypothetical protein